MSTTMTTQSSLGKRPCGCGGSLTATTGPCHCGKADCGGCQEDGFIRPRFFAGQLLTEDDLQSLADYVVGKNRMRNRAMFGSGVVCGLEVKPDPCSCAKVVVYPGYAIDCCGDDILVNCPQTLDINRMVRELKTQLRGGYDCGDPCPETNSETATDLATTGNATAASASSQATAGMVSNQQPAVPDVQDKGKKYCLYIDYCEQQTDAVAPYATGGSCGTPPCEATRVQEGFRFALRCPSKEDCEPGICERLTQCFGHTDDKVPEDDFQILRECAETVPEAVKQIRMNAEPPTSPSVIRETTSKLAKMLKNHSFTEVQTKELVIDLRNAAVAAAGLFPQIAAQHRQAKSLLEKSEGIFKDAVTRLDENLEEIQSPMWKSYANALLTQVTSLLTPLSTVPTQSAAGARATVPRELQLLMWGAVVTPAHIKDLIVAARKLEAWLDERQQVQRPFLETSYGLESATISDPLDYEQLGSFALELRRLVQSTSRFTQDCVCDALLPPCRTCSDQSVLIACITVKDCCVTEICNLDRTFILSPVALRYWIPAIHELGEAMEEFCCPSPCDPIEVRTPYTTRLTSKFAEPNFREAYRTNSLGALVIRELAMMCAPRQRTQQRMLRDSGEVMRWLWAQNG